MSGEKRMKKNNLFSFAIVLVILAALSLGCSSIQKIRDKLSEAEREVADSNVRTDPTEPSGGSTNETADGDLLAKANLYISKCFNSYSLRVVDSHRRYTSWMKDPKQGPIGNERIVYGLYELNGDGNDCAEAIEQAKSMRPEIPEIEEIADRYSASLKEVVGQINSIYSYYDQEDYKDDGFSRGKEAHPAVIAAFEKFEGINKEFAAQIDILENKVAVAQLEEFRGDPARQYEFAITEFKIEAKKILNYVRDHEYANMKPDDFQPMIESVEKSLEAVKAAKTSGSRPGGIPNFSSTMFPSNAEEFIKATKALMRRLRDKKPFSDFDRRALGTGAGWMIEGSPDQVVDRYNKLIRGI